jgi:hypothetical protein
MIKTGFEMLQLLATKQRGSPLAADSHIHLFEATPQTNKTRSATNCNNC